MTDLEQIVRALALAAFLFYLAAGARAFGLSPRLARGARLIAFVLLALAMGIAIWATFDWFVLRR